MSDPIRMQPMQLRHIDGLRQSLEEAHATLARLQEALATTTARRPLEIRTRQDLVIDVRATTAYVRALEMQIADVEAGSEVGPATLTAMAQARDLERPRSTLESAPPWRGGRETIRTPLPRTAQRTMDLGTGCRWLSPRERDDG